MENNLNPNLLPDLSQAEESGEQFTFFVYDMMSQNYLVSLLDMASFGGQQREEIEKQIEDFPNMTEDIFNEIAGKLQAHQMDRITNGFNYGATDIKLHIKKFRQ
jgi:hypothetical protein